MLNKVLKILNQLKKEYKLLNDTVINTFFKIVISDLKTYGNNSKNDIIYIIKCVMLDFDLGDTLTTDINNLFDLIADM